jgi:predicted ester cyclase
MTSKTDVVRAWTDSPAGDAQSTAAFLSEDFENVMADGTIQTKAEYVGMASMMYASLPDMHGVVSDLHEEGGAVIMTYHFEATFQNDLDLSAMGAGVIPASGKKVVWPEDTVKLTVEGDKIRRLEPQGSSGSIADFLAPLMG